MYGKFSKSRLPTRRRGARIRRGAKKAYPRERVHWWWITDPGQASRLIVLVAWAVCVAGAAPALAAELCLYTAADGVTHQVNGREEVPAAYREQATCLKERAPRPTPRPPQANRKPSFLSLPQILLERAPASKAEADLAAPEDIQLRGNVREESMASSIGRIRLRWPRSVERLFGRTPVRAMQEAAVAVSRTLKQSSGFPAHVRNLNLDWQVVFMDETLPERQIPQYLVSGCHPAWMLPPAQIYVVAQRVVSGCGGTKSSKQVADSRLAEVLIHEIGHAVEFALLPKTFAGDRVRAEGFATWFESYAARNSTLIDASRLRTEQFQLARASFLAGRGSGEFSGSAEDYARASLFFHAIVTGRQLRDLGRVYERMENEGSDFFSAVAGELNWDRERFGREVQSLLERELR